MNTLDTAGANAEQIRFWNEIAAPKWIALQSAIDRQLRPLGLRAIERSGFRPGDRVIDVGCGCGDTTIEIARRVRPGGFVHGIDVSAPMLERARKTASEIAGVTFENADAQTCSLPKGGFDVLYSRFGVMFFTDPSAAFANLRGALVPGGRLAFVCWRELRKNSWVFIPLTAAARHLPLPPPPGPDEPGPFSFADPDRVRRILSEAGFEHVFIEPVEEVLSVGGTTDLDEAVEFLLRIGPAAKALREADPAVEPRVARAVREALEPYHSADGVRMDSASWIVTARNPA